MCRNYVQVMKRMKHSYLYIVINVRKEKVLHRVKEQRNTTRTTKRRKANWIGHIFHRNFLLKQVIEGKVEVTGRRGRRSKPLLDNLKEKTGYCKFKEEALDRTVWRSHFGRGCGLFVSQDYE